MSGFERIDTTANRIRIAMNDAGKRQADLVRETGIDKGALSHYLKGRYEPKQDVVYKLAVALNVSEMWLWGYDCPKGRTVEQKNNDIISDAVVKMRTDKDFFSLIETIMLLDAEKQAAIKQMALALQK